MLVTRRDNFIPQAALIIYKSSQPKADSNYGTDEKIYVEAHTIDQKGTILSGQPLSETAANQLGKSLYKRGQTLASGLIPPSLLYLGWELDRPVLVWWTPPQQVTTYYTSNLKIPDGKINIPALVWKWSHNHRTLEIYALKNDKAPTLKDDLFFAPFHNVYEDGTVCLGSGTSSKLFKGDQSFANIMADVQKLFWRTRFSEIHNSNSVVGNLNSLHNELVTGIQFPLTKLVPAKKKLAQLCK